MDDATITSYFPFTLTASTGKRILVIHPDGRVEIGEGVTIDEASMVFWNAVRKTAGLYPIPMKVAICRQ